MKSLLIDLHECIGIRNVEDLLDMPQEFAEVDLELKRRLTKPCTELGWCPYGQTLAGNFPSTIKEAESMGLPTDNLPLTCNANVGRPHHCPAFYLGHWHMDYGKEELCPGASDPSACDQICCKKGFFQCVRGPEWRRQVAVRDLKEIVNNPGDYEKGVCDEILDYAWTPTDFS